MSRLILKLSGGGRDWYLEYSTIYRAPLTYGMSREDFEAYYRAEYGAKGMRELPERMARVDATGTSDVRDSSAWDTLLCNRAGKDESRLSLEQIVDYYCRNQPRYGEPCAEPPMGDVDLCDEDES